MKNGIQHKRLGAKHMSRWVMKLKFTTHSIIENNGYPPCNLKILWFVPSMHMIAQKLMG